MHSRRTLRRVALVAILSVSFLLQGTWTLAATTGGIAGIVNDDTGAPIAGATVTASSPSQVATTTTDSKGHFVFLVLAPDTYTLTVVKDGYQTTSLAGNTVFADQTQQVVLTAPRAIKVIAHVTGTAAGLVKPGVGGDIYNVTPSQQAASAALGGGGNLNSAYSAIASVPGVFLGTSEIGWDQAVVIHGQNPFFTGYEIEGVPMNRAFDNYPNTTESNLGLQELQIYTGGGPSDISSNGVSGFINNVIKTGTYPGYANLTLGTASEAFWHEAQLEVGGSTPDRNFSYYVGISGYDQAFRYIDNSDGAGYMTNGGVYQATDPYFTTESASGRGVATNCTPTQEANSTEFTTADEPDGCFVSGWGLYGSAAMIDERNNVVNLHFGIPRQDGQKDDIQVLWWDEAMVTYANSMLDEVGPGLTQGEDYLGWGDIGALGAGALTYPYTYSYNLPFGTVVDSSSGGVGTPYTIYGMPSASESEIGQSLQSSEYLDTQRNDDSALKLQWTHPFNDTSYMRIYAYSLYSDWLENSPVSADTDEYFAPYGLAPDYELNTHTVGASFAYANQLTDTDLLSFQGNYEQANTTRWNNAFWEYDYGAGGTPVGLVAEHGGQYTCYNPSNGDQVPLYECEQTNALTVATTGEPAVTGAAAAADAQYETLWDGNTTGDYNDVSPHFWNAALQDQWRPNDRWLFTGALRFDNFTEDLADGVNASDNMQTQLIQQDVCWSGQYGVLTNPIEPGEPPPASIDYTTTCPAGYVHPNGENGAPLFTDANTSGNQYTTYDFEPRFAFTFTQNPDTVWRFSAGRYAQPALSAADQYLFQGGGNAVSETWANFMNMGFFSPEHEIANMTSGQYNASFEHRFHGTDMSIKISPFYTATSNWFQDAFIGENYVTEVPVGRAKNYGVELALTDGDFASNGFAGIFSFTWTQSLVQFQNLSGTNQISSLNTVIEGYNKLTKAGGGSECYGQPTSTAPGAPEPCSTANAILNPYYDDPEQSLLNPNGWYPQGLIALSPSADEDNAEWYNSPYVASLVLNWRHERFAVTPSIQFQAGTPYGSPLDVIGIDPTDCYENQEVAGVGTTQNCDYLEAGLGAQKYGYLYVPDPQTGTFASPGEYSEPNIIMGNLQLSYDFPHVKLTLTATDLAHTCFGGSKEAWTEAYEPGASVCGYYANGLYNGAGWYNGSSPYDTAANGVTPYEWEEQSYAPSSSAEYNGYLPFNLYLQAQIHL